LITDRPTTHPGAQATTTHPIPSLRLLLNHLAQSLKVASIPSNFFFSLLQLQYRTGETPSVSSPDASRPLLASVGSGQATRDGSVCSTAPSSGVFLFRWGNYRLASLPAAAHHAAPVRVCTIVKRATQDCKRNERSRWTRSVERVGILGRSRTSTRRTGRELCFRAIVFLPTPF
jgi:hypothetical protein